MASAIKVDTIQNSTGGAFDWTSSGVRELTSGTTQASTSGTSIDFTGIPSWVKRITVMFNGVSTNSTNGFSCQLGISTGVEITGYISGCSYAQAGNIAGAANSTSSFYGPYASGAAITHSGHMVFTLVSGNIWVASGVLSTSNTFNYFCGGTKTLGGVLDRVRILTNSTDTFDAGSINIMYE